MHALYSWIVNATWFHCLEYVKLYYQEVKHGGEYLHILSGPFIAIELVDDTLKLYIPLDGVSIDGWSITPLTVPVVNTV